MSARIVVTGNLGRDPELRYTQNGKPVVSLDIAATHSRKNKDTDQWTDVGEPLWLKATFWDREAKTLAAKLSKGDRVSVEGTLTKTVYNEYENLEIHFPRFLGVIPRFQNTPQPRSVPATAAVTDDPWGEPNYGEAPF